MPASSSCADKVLYWYCGNPALKKRFYCVECDKYSHVSCNEKKKCCNAPQSQEDEDVQSVKNLVSAIDSLTSMVKEMKNTIDNLVLENKKVHEEIERLKNKQPQTDVTTQPLISDNQILEEIENRESRRCNLIISNLTEPRKETAEANMQDDLTMINNILTQEQEYSKLTS